MSFYNDSSKTTADPIYLRGSEYIITKDTYNCPLISYSIVSGNSSLLVFNSETGSLYVFRNQFIGTFTYIL
jgi:hypothetical protein